jgi:class 3 adenylate cyclase
MVVDQASTYPLPEDSVLAELASALNEAGSWAEIVDPGWRVVYTTDALQAAMGFLKTETAPTLSGVFRFGTTRFDAVARMPIGSIAVEQMRRDLAGVGSWVIEDLPGGRDELRSLADSHLHDAVDRIPDAHESSAITYVYDGYGVAGSRPKIIVTAVRVRKPGGGLAGTVLMHKPDLDMTLLAALGAMGDRGHFERMRSVAKADRRPGSVLFADLEGSTSLAKQLSTASYFALGRRMTRAADRCVVDAGGITGRHSGDGVVAFFLAENLGSESAAANACIRAARSLSAAMEGVATRSNLPPDALRMRFGLHWGSSLYVGLITTAGRTETTALGDDVNDAARIEACATGGRMLASKQLVERLTPDAADDLDLDLDAITYTQLGYLTTATDKARRDAPSIAVCEL